MLTKFSLYVKFLKSHNIPQDRFYYYLHFIDEAIEGQRGKVSHTRPHRQYAGVGFETQADSCEDLGF